ncbi:MAG: methylmalonyl-CoA mutase family protein, partial [Bdellovibrionales bacterium]
MAEIVSHVRGYKERVKKLRIKASQLGALHQLKNSDVLSDKASQLESNLEKEFTGEELKTLKAWDDFVQKYKAQEFEYQVRDRKIKQPLKSVSLSGTVIPRVSVPDLQDWGDRFRYLKLENVPGEFPFTTGVFHLKRTDEDPKRMFAGEGTPERTNRRFHYLTQGEPAARLSTAFDSVTLYGHDPENRPDIFGKVGESGVSICTLEDMKKLYAGFDLCSPN